MPSSEDASQTFPYGITGKTFPHRMLLCDDGQISYPSATLGKDGSIYIVYD